LVFSQSICNKGKTTRRAIAYKAISNLHYFFFFLVVS